MRQRTWECNVCYDTEKLARDVNGFKDRLQLPGKDADIENTYLKRDRK